jgi:hypothetical protein
MHPTLSVVTLMSLMWQGYAGSPGAPGAADSGSGSPLLSVLPLLSRYSGHALGLVFSAAVVTYVMFQLKMFPKSVSRIVSRFLFYPTYPITFMTRWGNFWCAIDETVRQINCITP